MPSTQTIDKRAFRVNLGILGVLTASAFAGGVYLQGIDSQLVRISDQLTMLRTVVDSTGAQVALNNRTLAVLDTRLASLERRVSALEDKLNR